MDRYQKFANSLGKKYLTSGYLKLDEPLSAHTTFKIGGPARVFFRAKNLESLKKAVVNCKKFDLPFFILGQGSNILVSDQGFEGVVIKNEAKKIKILGYQGKTQGSCSRVKNIFIEAESGVLVNRLVRCTLDQGLSGLENFLGLPGTVGGGIYTNAHNLKVKDFFGNHLVKAYLFDAQQKVQVRSQDYFEFDYEKSKIQSEEEVIVLSAVFSFSRKNKKSVWQKADKIIRYRLKTQPLDMPSAGCVFKNIKKSTAWSAPTPSLATSAGFLIDAAGLKGKKIGGAQVSLVHGNFILNTGQATAQDVIKLIRLIKKKVEKKFGVKLEEEIERVGIF